MPENMVALVVAPILVALHGPVHPQRSERGVGSNQLIGVVYRVTSCPSCRRRRRSRSSVSAVRPTRTTNACVFPNVVSNSMTSFRGQQFDCICWWWGDDERNGCPDHWTEAEALVSGRIIISVSCSFEAMYIAVVEVFFKWKHSIHQRLCSFMTFWRSSKSWNHSSELFHLQIHM